MYHNINLILGWVLSNMLMDSSCLSTMTLWISRSINRCVGHCWVRIWIICWGIALSLSVSAMILHVALCLCISKFSLNFLAVLTRLCLHFNLEPGNPLLREFRMIDTHPYILTFGIFWVHYLSSRSCWNQHPWSIYTTWTDIDSSSLVHF